MLLKNKYHITYCTNIHPGKNWEETFEQLKRHLPDIKHRCSESSQPFGVGLRLSNTASLELNEGDNLREFKAWLEAEDLYVFTMNGFPYGNFHNERVKDQVHTPDWTTEERLTYTRRLFEQLAYLLPEGMEGGISTSPVSYKHWFETSKEKEATLRKGAEQMIEIALFLHELEEKYSKVMHLDIEPEPDGFLENTLEVVDYFNHYLLPLGIAAFMDKLKLTVEQAKAYVLRYLTVCYDVCHFALAYESPKYTIETWKAHGIRVGKIQISAALRIPYLGEQQSKVWEALSPFNEPVYLHQVTENTKNGVVTYPDLPEILERKPTYTELRAHFHVPVFLKNFGVLQSTQEQITDTLNYLERFDFSHHLEVETYTWDVLPQSLKVPLNESVAREIQWVVKQLDE